MTTSDSERETKLVLVDGREALAVIIITPSTENPGRFVLEANVHGMTHRQAAWAIRHTADQWDAKADKLGEPKI